MAQFDSSIIFRQNPYTGPTVEDIQGKQNLNALRNTLGEGYNINDPKVINAMMARDPDMGLKLMTNANSMRKTESDAATAEQERMTTELDRYVPLAMAVAKNKDQTAWTELHGELTQVFPSLGRSLPTDVNLAGPAVQSYVAARQEAASKGGTTRSFGSLTPTDAGMVQVDPGTGEIRVPINPATGKPFMSVPKGSGDGGGSQETFSTTAPQTITLADGTVVPYVLGSYGTSRAVPLPPGATWNPPTTTVSTPTSTDVVQKGTGVVVASRAKDVIGAALQSEVGAARGKELAAAPAAVATGTRFLAQLDALDADPNIERGTGISSYFNFVRGSDGKTFQVKLNKAEGSAFLESIKGLQGTGAITDKEGGAATASVSGLDAGLDAASFRKELKILRDIVAKGLAKARANAAERDRILGITPTEEDTATPAPTGAGAPGAPALFSPEELAKLRGGQ